MEEAQHSKLDTLMVEGLAKGRSTQEIEAAVEEYLEIGGLIDGGLKQQVEFDLDAFIRATGRELNEEEKISSVARSFRQTAGRISARQFTAPAAPRKPPAIRRRLAIITSSC